MRRGFLIFGWLLAGHGVVAACYALLITLTDANALVLTSSALALLGGFIAWALTDATTLAWLVPGTSFREAWGRALRRGVPALALATALLLLSWWTVDRASQWSRAHAAEFDAWMIATFDTTRTSWAHRVVNALSYVLRNIVSVSLAASLMVAVVMSGLRGALSRRWIASGLSRYQLGLVAGAMVLLVSLPWAFAAWRPRGLPPTWVEAVFVGIKLAALVLLAHLAWLAVLFAAQHSYGSSRQFRPAPSARSTHAADRS